MKKSKYYLILMMVFFVFTACQKNKDSLSNSNSTSGSKTTGYTNVFGSLEALLILTNNTFNGPDTSYTANAFFYNTGLNNWISSNPSISTSAGKVKINSIGLKYYSVVENFYADTTFTLDLRSNINWQVQGASNIPTFNFAPIFTWPSYTGYYSLPDTIYTSKNAVINYNGISGGDSVNVTLSDGTYLTGHSSTSNRVSAQSASTTFLQTYLAKFTPTNTGSLSLQVYKFAPVQTFSGENFVFTYSTQFNKVVVIK
jgi:hypothetical protein